MNWLRRLKTAGGGKHEHRKQYSNPAATWPAAMDPLLRKMKYYDSFLVCCYLRPGEDEKKMAHHIEIAAYRLGFRVAIRTTKDGIRVWKIDNKEGRA